MAAGLGRDGRSGGRGGGPIRRAPVSTPLLASGGDAVEDTDQRAGTDADENQTGPSSSSSASSVSNFGSTALGLINMKAPMDKDAMKKGCRSAASPSP